MEPLVATAVMLWRPGQHGRELFWVKRGALGFAAGFFAFPGGGLDDEADRREAYLAHRREREANIVEALAVPGTLDEVTARGYQDTPFMLPLAARSCLASLEKLAREGRAAFDGRCWKRL